jgi:hypothetical protein
MKESALIASFFVENKSVFIVIVKLIFYFFEDVDFLRIGGGFGSMKIVIKK